MILYYLGRVKRCLNEGPLDPLQFRVEYGLAWPLIGNGGWRIAQVQFFPAQGFSVFGKLVTMLLRSSHERKWEMALVGEVPMSMHRNVSTRQ